MLIWAGRPPSPATNQLHVTLYILNVYKHIAVKKLKNVQNPDSNGKEML